MRKSLQIAIEAAKKRSEAMEHVLLYGPPGLGKTSLAHIIAKEMDANIRITSGPALEKAGDLAGLLTHLKLAVPPSSHLWSHSHRSKQANQWPNS